MAPRRIIRSLPKRAGKPYVFMDYTARRYYNTRQPNDVLIRQREYSHDAAVVTFHGSNARGLSPYRRFRKGTPIALRWGWAPTDLETFYGYVHSSKFTRRTKSTEEKLEVFLVAASHRMNQTRMRTFRRRTVGSIIATIARGHRFTVSADPSSRYHRIMPQLGRSDWNLMVKLAKDIGFTLSCKRTQVQFKRRVLDTASNGRQPTFHWYGPGVGPTRGSLFEFTHKVGTDPLLRVRKLALHGMDDNGKSFFADHPGREDCCNTEEPEFTEYQSEPVTSLSAAREAMSGLSKMNRFYVQASAVVSGVPKLRCGQTVRVTGTGEASQGYWWVGGVDHVLIGPTPGRPVSYRMSLTIGRETIEQVECIDDRPPVSWTGKPEVADPCSLPLDDARTPEVPTVFNPVDACAPLETPAKPKRGRKVVSCYCPPKQCPHGQHRVVVPPVRLDKWAARSVPKMVTR